MVEEWNKWMAENFVPGWINCLDESCPSGQTGGHVLGGCFALENPTPLVMNTILFVVVCLG